MITSALLDYVNVGSTTATTDRKLRQRAERALNNLAADVWGDAPWTFRKGSGSVTIASGANNGVCPADFDGRFGDQGGVFIAGNTIYPPLRYMPADQLYMLRHTVQQTGPQPLFYTLRDLDPTTFIPLLQVYPTVSGGTVTLTLENYVKAMTDLVDAATACTAAAGSATGLTGAYSYVVTYVTATGETEAGIASNTITVSNTKISVTGIPTSFMHSVTARKLYRTTAGGSTYGLVTTISDNTTTTYTDNTADGSLGAAPPTVVTAITGSQQFPDDLHDCVLIDGLKAELATTQGDVRDNKWKDDWRKVVKQKWANFKPGQNQTVCLPRYGTGAGLGSGWSGRWRTF